MLAESICRLLNWDIATEQESNSLCSSSLSTGQVKGLLGNDSNLQKKLFSKGEIGPASDLENSKFLTLEFEFFTKTSPDDDELKYVNT